MKALVLIFILGYELGRAGELAELHRASTVKVPTTGGHSSTGVSTNQSISEVGIERGWCRGNFPVYTFTVRSDGTFHYVGEANVDHLGKYEGNIGAYQFHRVAEFIKNSEFMQLDNSYGTAYTETRVVDGAPTYTKVVLNGKVKVVRNYSDAGPDRLWSVEQAIDALLARVRWGKTQKLPDAPK